MEVKDPADHLPGFGSRSEAVPAFRVDCREPCFQKEEMEYFPLGYDKFIYLRRINGIHTLRSAGFGATASSSEACIKR
ncbi:MAG: hypothetical protein PHO89_06935 [Methylacidiphilaceae bacterium]|nr:hypothetical protein [Candidatus Methylacidiphilaceae bacterium]